MSEPKEDEVRAFMAAHTSALLEDVKEHLMLFYNYHNGRGVHLICLQNTLCSVAALLFCEMAISSGTTLPEYLLCCERYYKLVADNEAKRKKNGQSGKTSGKTN